MSVSAENHFLYLFKFISFNVLTRTSTKVIISPKAFMTVANLKKYVTMSIIPYLKK